MEPVPCDLHHTPVLGRPGWALFIVNQNGSIQHSALEYKEDGDILIDAKEAKATFSKANSSTNVWDKYEVENAAVLENYIYVEYLNPEVVMPVGADKLLTNSNASRSNAQ